MKCYCLRQRTSKRDSCDLFALHPPSVCRAMSGARGKKTTAKSSPVGPLRGTNLGKMEIAPGTLSLVRGPIQKKKVEWDRGPNQRTVAAKGHGGRF